MNRVVEIVNERIEDLQEIIQIKEKEIRTAPKGIVNIVQSGNRTQYYYKNNSSDTNKRYLKVSEKGLVRDLCQKDYNEKVLAAAKAEYAMLQKVKIQYQKGTYEDVYDKLSDCRKKMVCPLNISDDEFVLNWENVEYAPKGFRADAPEYYTDRGERVRSKSEILIANALYKYHIPYRYEYPLVLKGFGRIHPDFMVLNVRLRKEFFWEHMGMMDDADYAEDALQRIHMYEKNDIFPGKKLILSHETMKNPLSTTHIEKLIMHYLR